MKLNNKEIIRFDHPEINVALDKSPGSFPTHWHISAEFVQALADGCVNTVGGTPYHLRQGDILLVWPAELHSTDSAPEGKQLILQFSPQILDQHHDLSMYLRQLTKYHLISRAEFPRLNGEISALLQEIRGFYYSGDPFIETEIKRRIISILLALARNAMEDPQSALSPLSSSNEAFIKIKYACSYISRHCQTDLSEEEIAQTAGLSRYYFSRMFRTYTGSTFKEYLSRKRIEQAVGLLSCPSLSITDTAFQSGFQSISSFNRVFRQITGCSPSRYRNLYARENDHPTLPPRPHS